ncbi:MAG: amino acid ABC transporter permease [Nevskiaceae bacterium]|jgi:polar amino acid transport system permease protein|nr:MAG: amino acid ABC transporter permease [Nevskiaceae bacterium]TAM26776.1 MAG: amino acid ABC transporter permease [Nevskiaceae bacterium]
MKPASPLWRLLTVALVLAIGAGMYWATLKVNYQWRWERVPEYLLVTGGEEVPAPFDGTVAVNGKQIRITPLLGGEPQAIPDIDVVQVSDGEIVFAGNTVGKKAGITPGPLLIGLWVTLKISALSLVFALVLGLIAGLGRVAHNPAARDLAAIYVELIRGTPLLVQMFIVYFFLGTVLNLSGFVAGVTSLAVFTGAYVAEIVRAGIEAVPKGQMEAARSLGMSHWQGMRKVVLPQALKRSLPPLAGQGINLIKDSSLVSIMALTDLTKAGREVVSSTFSPFEVWFTVALMYLLLTGALSVYVRKLEKKMAHD